MYHHVPVVPQDIYTLASHFFRTLQFAVHFIDMYRFPLCLWGYLVLVLVHYATDFPSKGVSCSRRIPIVSPHVLINQLRVSPVAL